MFLLDHARKVKQAVSIPVILVGGVCSLANMEKALNEGFEFVQIGRATGRDPDFVNKLKSGTIQGSDCDHCNRCVGEMADTGVRCVCLDEGRALPVNATGRLP
jgi:2,4-dienoyl-CoA reductase-like NADH-dependent reductase (Old Yellow Enzyme family)